LRVGQGEENGRRLTPLHGLMALVSSPGFNGEEWGGGRRNGRETFMVRGADVEHGAVVGHGCFVMARSPGRLLVRGGVTRGRVGYASGGALGRGRAASWGGSAAGRFGAGAVASWCAGAGRALGHGFQGACLAQGREQGREER
jgi:hypothetical protein